MERHGDELGASGQDGGAGPRDEAPGGKELVQRVEEEGNVLHCGAQDGAALVVVALELLVAGGGERDHAQRSVEACFVKSDGAHEHSD